MEKIQNIIHYNRDENSFTARFFESLVPKFLSDNSYFQSFVDCIFNNANRNKIELRNESLGQFHNVTLVYTDSMPFMENMDLYSFCKLNKIPVKLNKQNIDKTEFDYVITAVNDEGEDVFIVFEVKCFSDLDKKEIERQNKLLKIYQGAGLYHRFYHFALISEENFTNGKVIRNKFMDVDNLGIITWGNVGPFINYKRFRKEIEFEGLHKTISRDGIGRNKRFLLKK